MEREISMAELELEVGLTLSSLRVQFKKIYLIKDVSVQFVCENFGVVVSAINRADYGYVNKTVQEKFPDHRCVYVSTFDNLLEAKDEIIWVLMEGGYMKFIRMNFPRQFNDVITMQGFGNKIIDERLRRWANQPKYKFLIEENEKAKDMPATMVLSAEPGFFDHMPR